MICCKLYIVDFCILHLVSCSVHSLKNVEQGEGLWMYRIKDRTFIGLKIRDRRKELGLTQEKLAETLGITYQQLQRYENGTGYLNTDRLQAIANALDVPITYFFEEKGETKVSIMDRGYSYNMSSEEREFVAWLRKIDNSDYKKSILTFLQLAVRKGKRP